MSVSTLSDVLSGDGQYTMTALFHWARPLDQLDDLDAARRVIPKRVIFYVTAAAAQTIGVLQALDYAAHTAVGSIPANVGVLGEWGAGEWGVMEWGSQLPQRLPPVGLRGAGVAVSLGITFLVADLFKLNRTDLFFKAGAS